jgi:hypothetical protein
MIAATVFLSIFMMAVAVIFGAVLYAIVALAAHGLASVIRLLPRRSSTPAPPLGMGRPSDRAPILSADPLREAPAFSAQTTWERIQGTQPARAARRLRRSR